MKALTAVALLALGSALVVGSPEVAEATQPNGSHHGKGPVSGAPRPIAGANLPILAIGFGIYWLIKRRKAQWHSCSVVAQVEPLDFRKDRTAIAEIVVDLPSGTVPRLRQPTSGSDV